MAKYGINELMPGYPGRTRDEVGSILKEVYERPLVYEPYTHFAERPFKGRFVNVSEAGFRSVENQGPWPPDRQNLNVFVFGGSTTFGYGIADAETIPSALQRKLRAYPFRKRVCVYNFGCCFYYSTQERILFSNLLAAEMVPDVVVFIDGLNDFFRLEDAPQFSSSFMGVINKSFVERKGMEADDLNAIIPKRLNRSFGKNEENALKICERFLRNKRVIEDMAKSRGIGAIFVWQPVPSYKFDLQFHPFEKSPNFREYLYPAVGYRHMAQLRQTNSSAGELLWLADMQENAHEQLYVDAVHYTAKMCEQIAGEIAQFIREKSLIVQ